jgi:hypothetical protein
MSIRYPVSCFERLFPPARRPHRAFNLAVVSKALTCAAKQASSSRACAFNADFAVVATI